MSEAVLDSSALLALLFREPGWERVEALLPDALISTVNLAETAIKLLERGMTAQTARAAVDATGVTVAPHTTDQAWAAAALRASTRAAGLSLGDRACLALARERRAKAYTSDQAWGRLGLDKVEIIR